MKKNNSDGTTNIVAVSVIHLSNQINDEQTELKGFTILLWLIQTFLSWNYYPYTRLFMPFNKGCRLEHDYVMLVHIRIYWDPTERRRMRHFFLVSKEEAIRIHRCSTGDDKYHHDCFCIDKPPLIKGALRGDADKVAPFQRKW